MKFDGIWEKLEAKRLFAEIIIHKILVTNFSFYVKQCPTRKAQFLFFCRFLLILTKKSIFRRRQAPRL